LHQVGDLFELNVKLRCQKVKHVLTNLQNKQALFLNRNPKVGLRIPEGRRISRLSFFSPDAMKKYLKNLALVRGKTSSLKGKFLM